MPRDTPSTCRFIDTAVEHGCCTLVRRAGAEKERIPWGKSFYDTSSVSVAFSISVPLWRPPVLARSHGHSLAQLPRSCSPHESIYRFQGIPHTHIILRSGRLLRVLLASFTWDCFFERAASEAVSESRALFELRPSERSALPCAPQPSGFGFPVDGSPPRTARSRQQ